LSSNLLHGLADRIEREPDGPVAGYFAALESSNDLEATLRVASSLHSFVLEADPRAVGLRPYYGTVGGETSSDDEAFAPALAKAIDELGEDLVHRARTWPVQTNETGRGLAWLIPAAAVGADAVHLVELGTSAGLNLYAEHRAYELRWPDGTVRRVGRGFDPKNEHSSGENDHVEFAVQVRGPTLGEATLVAPEVLSRVGCDQQPIDLDQVGAATLLRACIWGDQPDRLRRLEGAMSVHRAARDGTISPRAELVQCELPGGWSDFVTAALPRRPIAPVVLVNTYVTAYFSDVEHRALERAVRKTARDWSVQHRLPWMWVRFEPPRHDGGGGPNAAWCSWRVEIWEGTHHREFELGWAHPHLTEVDLGEGLLDLLALRGE
jgi:hypothetical protein